MQSTGLSHAFAACVRKAKPAKLLSHLLSILAYHDYAANWACSDAPMLVLFWHRLLHDISRSCPVLLPVGIVQHNVQTPDTKVDLHHLHRCLDTSMTLLYPSQLPRSLSIDTKLSAGCPAPSHGSCSQRSPTAQPSHRTQ